MLVFVSLDDHNHGGASAVRDRRRVGRVHPGRPWGRLALVDRIPRRPGNSRLTLRADWAGIALRPLLANWAGDDPLLIGEDLRTGSAVRLVADYTTGVMENSRFDWQVNSTATIALVTVRHRQWRLERLDMKSRLSISLAAVVPARSAEVLDVRLIRNNPDGLTRGQQHRLGLVAARSSHPSD